VYHARSPVYSANRISAALIIFQGLEDAVVPPSQAEILVAALRSKGLPFAFQTFAGEGHGFRKAETIKAALLGELSFYGQLFGFEPAGQIPAIEIENLPPRAHIVTAPGGCYGECDTRT
jgi:dipeptidyl aminopeptidase/acylaminoacyl peptidase